MFRKLGVICAGLALFSIAGGHWAVLQSVAWAQMLLSYSQSAGSLTVAVDQTFDGHHPCPLCQDIQAAKAKERKESPSAPGDRDDAKLKAVSTDQVLRAAQRFATGLVFPGTGAAFARSRVEAPPTPPPRHGVVAA